MPLMRGDRHQPRRRQAFSLEPQLFSFDRFGQDLPPPDLSQKVRIPGITAGLKQAFLRKGGVHGVHPDRLAVTGRKHALKVCALG